MYNFIGIDASLKSTAVSIYSNNKEYIFNYTTENNKWIKSTSQLINYYEINYYDLKDYTLNELNYFKKYEEISETIIKDIKNSIDLSKKLIISIEGYSYSSMVGYIIDLVTFTTILKKKLFDNFNIHQFNILSPSTVKVQICKMVYNTFDKKRKTYIRHDGISGGKFEKKDMMIALLDSNINTILKNYLEINKSEILKTKKISKPFDDIVDAIIINNITIQRYNNRKNKINKIII